MRAQRTGVDAAADVAKQFGTFRAKLDVAVPRRGRGGSVLSRRIALAAGISYVWAMVAAAVDCYHLCRHGFFAILTVHVFFRLRFRCSRRALKYGKVKKSGGAEIHHIGGRTLMLQLVGHEIHIGSDVVEVCTVALAEIV